MRPFFLVPFFSFFLIVEMAFSQVPAQPSKKPVKEDVKEVEISQIQQFLEPFRYDRSQFRDPFESQSGGAPLEPGQVYGPFLFLQTFRLDQLKLKGLLWKTKRPVAVFRDPKGMDHRLTIKDYVGENFGYIATIREKEVVVIQTIEENNKRYSTTKVVFLE